MAVNALWKLFQPSKLFLDSSSVAFAIRCQVHEWCQSSSMSSEQKLNYSLSCFIPLADCASFEGDLGPYIMRTVDSLQYVCADLRYHPTKAATYVLQSGYRL